MLPVFRLWESPMSVRDSQTSHHMTWPPHSPLDLSSHTSTPQSRPCLNVASEQLETDSALGEQDYLTAPARDPLLGGHAQSRFRPSNPQPAYPMPLNLAIRARQCESPGSSTNDHAQLNIQALAEPVGNLTRHFHQPSHCAVTCSEGHRNHFQIPHPYPTFQSPTFHQQPSFTDSPVRSFWETPSPLQSSFRNVSRNSALHSYFLSPLSSCCGGSPSPVPWLTYSPATDHVVNTDDSGYISSPASSVNHASHHSPNSSYTQVGLNEAVHDMFQDICDNKENASPVRSSRSYQKCKSNKSGAGIVHSAALCRVGGVVKAPDYLYITTSRGGTKVTVPERRLRKQKREENKQQCPICGQRLASRANLQVHLRRHTGQKPHACDFCQKRFAQRSSLRTHIRTHTGERPYACTVCPQTFRDYSTFTKHYRIHSGQRPYKCDICGKGFTQAGNMVRHRAIHNKKS